MSVRQIREYAIPFLAFPPEVRRVIYTTNAIETLNRRLRKVIKNRGRDRLPGDSHGQRQIAGLEDRWRGIGAAARALKNRRHPSRRANSNRDESRGSRTGLYKPVIRNRAREAIAADEP
jgi:hypothetical protein